MKTELADYLNNETDKLKALQKKERAAVKKPVVMASIPISDVLAMRDILGVILGDDELRRQFRVCAGVSVPEMNRIEKGLNVAVKAYLG